MSNYSIISKQEFNSLYRFGKLPIRQEDFLLSEKEDELFQNKLYELFLTKPLFEGEEEYLIIKCERKINNDCISVQEIEEIIPLTQGSKFSYETKFDSRICFSNARFVDIVKRVETRVDLLERTNGMKALSKMMLPKEFQNKEELYSSYIEKAYVCRINGQKSSEIHEDFLTHLLVYERYDFHPNTDLGLLYDIGEIFANSKGKPHFKGSGFHSFLEKNKPELQNRKLSDLLIFMEQDHDEVKPFKNHLTKESTRQYISGALFLKFKEELFDKDSIFDTNIPQIVKWAISNKEYLPEVIEAINLIGGFFGYKKFYDDYYERIDLKFFKSQFKIQENFANEVKINEEKKAQPTSIIQSNFESSLNNLQSDNTAATEEISNFPLSDTEKTARTPEEAKDFTNGQFKSKKESNIFISKGTLSTEEQKALEELKNLIGNSEVKIYKENLKQIKEILKPISVSKRLNKDIIAGIVKEKFSESLFIENNFLKKIVNQKLSL